MNIKSQNISNLISLWETVGSAFQNIIRHNGFSYCYITGSEWPNRLWFDKDEPLKETIKAAVEITHSSPVPLFVTYWGGNSNTFQIAMEALAFIKKAEQIGMSLRLEQEYKSLHRIRLQRVSKENEANLWAEIYSQSFGYTISAATLINTKDAISYYLIYMGKQLIGTVITHHTKNTIGIHGMGILPQFRKQGFAEEAMATLLNMAFHNNIPWATLQSSAMGKRLYMNMGFTEDFSMTTYGQYT